MSDIKKAFENGKAVIPFVTAGDPDLATTEKLLIEMSKNGADLIQIGIPFSDPIAEGVEIQEADIRALAGGTTTDKIFDMVKRVRAEVSCPLAIMTYMNPIFVYGTDRFMAKCAECGIEAVIVPDVPFEEKAELSEHCDNHGIALISLIAPTSQDRVRMIAKEAQGFIFCIPATGVTGVKGEIIAGLEETMRVVREVCDTPCAIGIGNPSVEEAAEAAKASDGVIIGAQVVSIVAKYGKDSIEPVIDYIKSIKNAVK